MVLAPRSCGYIAWAVNFPYLIYLHVINASGRSWAEGVMDFTGCEMVLVLKLVSIAMCYQDQRSKKKGELSEYQAAHVVRAVPSPLAYSSYVFALGNLLAGPYMEFSDYQAFINGTGVWAKGTPQASPVRRALVVLLESLVYMACHLALLGQFGPAAYTRPAYQASGFPVRAFIQWVTGITNQLKYAFAWKLSEASLVLAGLDYLGPDAEGKPQWGRVCNVRFVRLLTCDSARLITGYWNIGTGKFLRRYVYERLTPKGGKPGFAQLLATQMVSAVWHGLYAGYLLFFAGSALWINFSGVIFKLEQRFLAPAVASSWPWYLLKLAWTHYTLNYMASAFMVLELWGSLAVYTSVWCWPHVAMLAGNVLGSLLVGGGGKGKAGKKGAAKTE